jgi:hypothetical protein
MYLRTCVSKEGGDGKGVDSQSLSDTFRYINLAGLVIGMVALCGPMHLCACVNEESGNGEGTGSQTLYQHYCKNQLVLGSSLASNT